MKQLITSLFIFITVVCNGQFISNYQIISDIDKTKVVEATTKITIDVLDKIVLLRIGDVEYRDTIVRTYLYRVREDVHTYRVSTKEGDYFFTIRVNRNTQEQTIIEAEWRPYDGLVTVYKQTKA